MLQSCSLKKNSLAEGDVGAGGLLRRALEQGHQRQHQQEDDHPQGEVAKVWVHRVPIDSGAAKKFRPGPAILDVI